MSILKSKVNSPEEFWNAVEVRYGEVPNLVKLILQVNGFNSFLALKGIRYEDKQEFFQSLELTVLEILNSEFDVVDKKELEAELSNCYQIANNFRIKPGHRNYIMNLMMEIEKSDVQEFFGLGQPNVSNNSYQSPKKSKLSPTKHDYNIAEETLPESSNRLILNRSNEKQIVLNQVDHGYSRDDQEASEFIIEEEYLSDENCDTLDVMDSLIKLEYDPGSSSSSGQHRKRKSSSSAPSSARRKPDHMYNEEFMMKCVNPRRRRVTLNKTYPKSDEGTHERFSDLIQQSMQCILPCEKLSEVENVEIELEKESETSWAVYCPLCHSRIRLPVVFENGGRYCNYKRSNFERHLRFKHCKTNQKKEFEPAIYDTVEMIEEIVD